MTTLGGATCEADAAFALVSVELVVAVSVVEARRRLALVDLDTAHLTRPT